jgi:poly-gamma-glutamate synthesis protein (capsule biosynthesis protein)
MNYFNENECNAEIFTFHWGIEREYKQNSTQQKVGRYAIDKGADLVVGHHSHVIQGIEEYNGKYIVYSLSNFCFGGNTNPPDKDTFVFNMSFAFEDGILSNTKAKIYPARVSSVNNRNDYKPTLAEGAEFSRILAKVLKYSNVKALEDGTIIE